MLVACEEIINVLPRNNPDVNVLFITVCMQTTDDKILGKYNFLSDIPLSSLVSVNILCHNAKLTVFMLISRTERCGFVYVDVTDERLLTLNHSFGGCFMIFYCQRLTTLLLGIACRFLTVTTKVFMEF